MVRLVPTKGSKMSNPNSKLRHYVSGAIERGEAEAITERRPISTIAREIEADWSKIGKGINYAAKPYLNAMKSLNSIQDAYGADTGKSVVLYFLSNAASYRGETARRLKAELKAMI